MDADGTQCFGARLPGVSVLGIQPPTHPASMSVLATVSLCVLVHLSLSAAARMDMICFLARYVNKLVFSYIDMSTIQYSTIKAFITCAVCGC